jgi:hypothetical protein
MQGGYFDVVSGQPVTIAGGALTLPAWSAQVLLPAADPCAQ